MTSAPEISPRLYRALGDAFGEMDPAALELVASSLREGALPWFLDELADAIRLGLLRPALWEQITGVDAESELDVDAQLREGWAILAPDRAFPLA